MAVIEAGKLLVTWRRRDAAKAEEPRRREEKPARTAAWGASAVRSASIPPRARAAKLCGRSSDATATLDDPGTLPRTLSGKDYFGGMLTLM